MVKLLLIASLRRTTPTVFQLLNQELKRVFSVSAKAFHTIKIMTFQTVELGIHPNNESKNPKNSKNVSLTGMIIKCTRSRVLFTKINSA